jgi:hypothetical protein
VKRFILNRFGVVNIDHSSSENQCKEEGWTRYRYHIKAKCRTNLDENGFVIEHNKIHETVKRVFRKADSCENLCLKIEEALRKLFNKENVHCVELYIKIHPLLEAWVDDYAFMEYEATYD